MRTFLIFPLTLMLSGHLKDPVDCGRTYLVDRAVCIRDLTSDLKTTREKISELRSLERRTVKILKEVSR